MFGFGSFWGHFLHKFSLVFSVQILHTVRTAIKSECICFSYIMRFDSDQKRQKRPKNEHTEGSSLDLR